MKSRRDLMRAFGIGSFIAPVIGSTIDESCIAQLIEIPKLKPIEVVAKIPAPLDTKKIRRASLILECSDGTHRHVTIDIGDKFGIIEPTGSIEIAFQSGTGYSPVTWGGSIDGIYR